VRPYYDVIIMGGGPAGATLGALLAKKSDLRIAIFEKEHFPREHIGESMAHPVTPVLEESGALAKVLASDCWVKKYGGVYSWDHQQPKVALFDHANYLADGVHRWTMHLDRPRFDHILLDHAEECGVDVFQGVSVRTFDSGPEESVVTLKDGTSVRCGYFVDASGRRNSIAAKQKRSWLSGYRNIAIWQHFLGGEYVQSIEADWNIFHADDISPIGCFAFRDGWAWYIPVPKWIDGERHVTHSLGIVTNPDILKQPDKDFTDQSVFLKTVKEIPILRDLIQDITPVGEKMLTATNYSMINDRFADYDERWVLVGDASYFVDPLFSSGVAFALTQASTVATLLAATAGTELSEQDKRDLWRDYDEGWHGMAETFSLSIDQWYHAIGKSNPDSIYWKSRGTTIDLDIQERTFDALLNTAFTPDLLQVITQGSRNISDLDPEGPFVAAAAMADPEGQLRADTVLALAADATVREGVGLEVPGFKAFIPPPPYEMPEEVKAAIARYWEDPVANGDAVPSPNGAPQPCFRFALDGGDVEVTSLTRDGAGEVAELLSRGPVRFDELVTDLAFPQLQLVKRLLRAGIVVTAQATAAAA
jgi:flavin-dependent dehydrogenase